MKDEDEGESEISMEEENKIGKKNKTKKSILTFLIVCSYLCLGCYRTLPGPTLLYLKHMVDEKITSMPIIFTTRSFGYVIGLVVGGIYFDGIRSPHIRHMTVICVKILAAVTAIGIPYCTTLTALAATFFAAGVCLSVLDVGFNTYLLHLWKGECHSYFQTLHFFYAVGSTIGPILARSFIEDIDAAKNSNSTQKVDVMNLDMPTLMFAYVFLCAMFVVVAALWIFMSLWPSACYRGHGRIVLSSRMPTKSFFCFGLFTTILLCFIVGTIDLGYQHMLATFAFTSYGFSTVHSADLMVAFWGCYTFGSLISIFLSLRFHPFCMIICNLLLEIGAAVILILLAENDHQYIFLGNAILGLGASSLFSNTVLWFHTYVKITHKIMAVLLIGLAVAEMVIPELLNAILKHNFHGLFYFVAAVPAAYLGIFIFQCVGFFPFGEKYVTNFGKKSSRVRVFPVFLYSFLRIVHSDSQTKAKKGPQHGVIEPRHKTSAVQTDATDENPEEVTPVATDQEKKQPEKPKPVDPKPVKTKGRDSEVQTEQIPELPEISAPEASPEDSGADAAAKSNENEKNANPEEKHLVEEEAPDSSDQTKSPPDDKTKRKKSLWGQLFQKGKEQNQEND